MRYVIASLLLVFTLVVTPAPPAAAQPRAALVIGNNVYLRLGKLANAVNDARAIAEELRNADFNVTNLLDARATEIDGALRRFLASIANGGVGFFYFSGHGVQIDGRNFLVPIDYSLDQSNPSAGLLSLPGLLDEIDKAKPKLAVIVLDACRDEPFQVAAPAKPASRGLSEIARPLPAGTLVLYAASSNQSALDSLPGQPTKHGLFTGELLETLRKGNLEIRDVAQRVRYTVMQKARAAGHLQIPAIYENLAAGAFHMARHDPRASQQPPSLKALPARIKLVLPFAAGGPSDVLTRIAMPAMAKEFGREVTAENIIDVQGDRVTAMLANGPKDGSVLLVSPFAAAARRIKGNDGRLAPVGMLFDTPLSLVVNSQTPARDLGELIAGARKSARPLVMQVSRPPGSPTDICGQQTAKKLGPELIQLMPVNGEALAVKAAVDGTADLICTSTMALRSMAAANPSLRLKELAEVRWSASPSTEALRVKGVGPQGYDITAPNWLAVFTSAEVFGEVRDNLSAVLVSLQQNPDFIQAVRRGYAHSVSADQATADGLLNALRLGVALQDLN